MITATSCLNWREGTQIWMPTPGKPSALRQSLPYGRLIGWLETVNPAGGSRLAKAVTYAKNQKPYMENYLLDGRCSISNNIAENIARPYAVGRKNFLFHDTVRGARASAIVYSLVETAKLNHLNIYAYLETVLLYMPDYKNEPEGIEELMPWSEMIQQRCRMKSKN